MITVVWRLSLLVQKQTLVPTLEHKQKKVEFPCKEGIDMFKLEFTLPKEAKMTLHRSGNVKIISFGELDMDWLSKVLKDTIGGKSKVSMGLSFFDRTNFPQMFANGFCLEELVILSVPHCSFLCLDDSA